MDHCSQIYYYYHKCHHFTATSVIATIIKLTKQHLAVSNPALTTMKIRTMNSELQKLLPTVKCHLTPAPLKLWLYSALQICVLLLLFFFTLSTPFPRQPKN